MVEHLHLLKEKVTEDKDLGEFIERFDGEKDIEIVYDLIYNILKRMYNDMKTNNKYTKKKIDEDIEKRYNLETEENLSFMKDIDKELKPH